MGTKSKIIKQIVDNSDEELQRERKAKRDSWRRYTMAAVLREARYQEYSNKYRTEYSEALSPERWILILDKKFQLLKDAASTEACGTMLALKELTQLAAMMYRCLDEWGAEERGNILRLEQEMNDREAFQKWRNQERRKELESSGYYIPERRAPRKKRG